MTEVTEQADSEEMNEYVLEAAFTRRRKSESSGNKTSRMETLL